MNWGYKIVLVYVVFVAGIGILVYKSSVQNQDLVTKDYYDQELKYQDIIDETVRANALHSPVTYSIGQNEIVLNFPEEMKGIPLQASILLYCPAEKSKDIQRDLSTGDAVIHFPISAVNKGMYELKISWVANKLSYYYEHKIMIP